MVFDKRVLRWSDLEFLIILFWIPVSLVLDLIILLCRFKELRGIFNCKRPGCFFRVWGRAILALPIWQDTRLIDANLIFSRCFVIYTRKWSLVDFLAWTGMFSDRLRPLIIVSQCRDSPLAQKFRRSVIIETEFGPTSFFTIEMFNFLVDDEFSKLLRRFDLLTIASINLQSLHHRLGFYSIVLDVWPTKLV